MWEKSQAAESILKTMQLLGKSTIWGDTRITKILPVELENTWFHVGIFPNLVEYWLFQRNPDLWLMPLA